MKKTTNPAPKLQLSGFARRSPGTCSFVTLVFKDTKRKRYVQTIEDHRVKGFLPARAGERTTAIDSRAALTAGSAALYGLEWSPGRLVIGTKKALEPVIEALLSAASSADRPVREVLLQFAPAQAPAEPDAATAPLWPADEPPLLAWPAAAGTALARSLDDAADVRALCAEIAPPAVTAEPAPAPQEADEFVEDDPIAEVAEVAEMPEAADPAIAYTLPEAAPSTPLNAATPLDAAVDIDLGVEAGTDADTEATPPATPADASPTGDAAEEEVPAKPKWRIRAEERHAQRLAERQAAAAAAAEAAAAAAAAAANPNPFPRQLAERPAQPYNLTPVAPSEAPALPADEAQAMPALSVTLDLHGDWPIATGATSVLRIRTGKFTVHVSINTRRTAQRLVVTFQGAHGGGDASGNGPGPVFARRDFEALFDAPILAISDPVLENGANTDEACAGFYMGTMHDDLVPELNALIDVFCDRLGVPRDAVLMYGSAAGGAAAILVGSRREHKTGIVAVCPWLRPAKYKPALIEAGMRAIGATMEEYEQMMQDAPWRYSPLIALKDAHTAGQDIRLVVGQNLKDAATINRHFPGLWRRWNIEPEGGVSPDGRVMTLLYRSDDAQRDHEPAALAVPLWQRALAFFDEPRREKPRAAARKAAQEAA